MNGYQVDHFPQLRSLVLRDHRAPTHPERGEERDERTGVHPATPRDSAGATRATHWLLLGGFSHTLFKRTDPRSELGATRSARLAGGRGTPGRTIRSLR